MRTTVDIPDQILREAKADAALQGLRLKEYFTEALVAKLRGTSAVHPDSVQDDSSSRVQWKKMGKFSLPVIPPVGSPDIDPDLPAKIAKLEELEDLERHGDSA